MASNSIESVMIGLSDEVLSFAREIVSTKSLTGGEEAVAHQVEALMRRLGYDEVTVDPMGTVLGRIGSGPKSLLFDSHMDTVAVIDEAEWTHPPFRAVVEDGKLYGRGAVDMKCPLVSSVFGAYIAKQVGLPEDVTIYVSASTMEEDYDGEAVRYLLSETGLRPDGVVICEPTGLRIATGHRGRALFQVNMPGRACHGSTPELGENPVYAMTEIVDRVRQLAEKLSRGSGERGSVALTNIYCDTASNNSVPADATIILDRRLALGEDESTVSREMNELVRGTKATWSVCDIPGTSWKGTDFLFHSFLPAWNIERDHPLVTLAGNAYRQEMGREPELFRMIACTNGVTTAGMYHLPTIVFGPGDLTQAHGRDEYCDIAGMLDACKIYASMCLGL